MTENDLDGFVNGLTGVMGYYGKTVSEFQIRMWFDILKPFDLAAITTGFRRHVGNPDSGQFPPKPADIVRILGGTSEDKALVAWSKVDRAVRHVGTWVSVVFDDALIHRVLHDMGGWVGLSQKTEDEWPFVAREFENRYRGYAMRNERPEYPRVLIGLSDASNAQHGFAGDPPRLIGEELLARAVLEGGTNKPLISFTIAADLAPNITKLRLVEKPAA